MMFGVQIQCLQVAFSKKLGQRTIIGDIDLSSILSSLLLYFTHLWLWIQIKHNTMLDLISVLSFLVLFLQNNVIFETMSFWRDSKNNTKKKKTIEKSNSTMLMLTNIWLWDDQPMVPFSWVISTFNHAKNC